MKGQSPPSDSNRDHRSYKDRALPIELGGQLIVASPPNAPVLTVAGGVYSKGTLRAGGLIDRDDVDASGAWAMDDEQIDIVLVVACHGLAGVRPDARSTKDHTPATKSARLTLDTPERTVDIEHQVVTVVVSERKQYAIAASNELGEDDRLGPDANVDRMRASGGRGRQTHLPRAD
jgi:hypothetical protein